MCLNVEQIHRQGKYKENTYNGMKGENYNITAWKKCGTCIECMNEKANAWVVRNKYEIGKHKEKCFITLTYARNPTILIKKDLQDFIKRLRKYIDKYENGKKIKYYGCGEYGTLKGRPHYHLVLYGWKPKDAIFKEFSKKGHAIYTSETIRRIWKHGIITVQKAENNTIPYMSLYNSPNNENRKRWYASKERVKKYMENYRVKGFYEKAMKLYDEEKNNWLKIKEFNVWSQGLGFDKFYEDKIAQTTWTKHCGDMEIPIPTNWIKRIANYGELHAIEEMQKRKKIAEEREQTVKERKTEKAIKAKDIYQKDRLQWAKEREKTEDL